MRLLAHNSIFSLNITINACVDKARVCVASSSKGEADFQTTDTEKIEQNYFAKVDFDSYVNRSSGNG